MEEKPIFVLFYRIDSSLHDIQANVNIMQKYLFESMKKQKFKFFIHLELIMKNIKIY
jgi:hypothetical protein